MKHLISFLLSLTLLLSPLSPALAQSITTVATTSVATSSGTTDLLAEIQKLLTLITSLQTQLNELKAEQTKVTQELGASSTTIVTPTVSEETESALPLSVTPLPTVTLTRTLGRGTTGNDVRELQLFLKSLPGIYPEGLLTNFYGPLTEKAVQRFQTEYGIVDSGTAATTGFGAVGLKTRAKIHELMTEGAGRSGNIPSGLLTAPGIQKKLEVGTTTSIFAPTITPSGTIPAQPVGQTGTTTVPAIPAQQSIPSTSTGITVLSPNGGEQWIKDNTYQITWHNPISNGFPGDRNFSWKVTVEASDGRFWSVGNFAVPTSLANWTIPLSLPDSGTAYKARVTLERACTSTPCPSHADVLHSTSFEDISDNTFSIYALAAVPVPPPTPVPLPSLSTPPSAGTATTTNQTATTTAITPPPPASSPTPSPMSPPASTPSSTSGIVTDPWIICRPKPVWNGSEYGLLWAKGSFVKESETCSNTYEEIYFNRYTSAGVKLGQDLVVSFGHKTAYSGNTFALAWNGTEFVAVWHDNATGSGTFHYNNYFFSLFFSRISAQGQKIGSDVKIFTNTTPNNPEYSAMNLLWNGSEYVLFFSNGNGSKIQFRKLSSSGQAIGSTKVVIATYFDRTSLSATWTGTEYALSWKQYGVGYGTITSARVSADGDLITTGTVQDTTAPSVPTNLTATASATSSQVFLGWTGSTDVVGVTGYKIYRNSALVTSFATSQSMGAGAKLAYTDTGLSVGTTYSYTLAAYDAAGNVSAQSNVASATLTTAADTTAPSVPTNLTATASTTPSQVLLSWTPSTDNVIVAGYKIYRNGILVASPERAVLYTISGMGYMDIGVIAGTTYSYTLAAYDAAGNVSAQTNSVSVTIATITDTTAPTVPIAPTLSVDQTYLIINLSWPASTDTTGVVGYKIYRCFCGNTADMVYLSSVTGHSYSDVGLAGFTTYTYTVAAYDAAGNISAQSSGASGTTEAQIGPPPTGGTNASSTASTTTRYGNLAATLAALTELVQKLQELLKQLL